MTRLGVWYDFRNPARWRVPWPQLYRETLDQAAYAEALGFASIWVSEHHFSEEGYLPALSAVLASEGYEVVVAKNGREAIERFQEGRFDVALLDLNMPVKGGWEAFERLTTIPFPAYLEDPSVVLG